MGHEVNDRNKSIKNLLNKIGLDYNNCLVNLSNSILKKFGSETTANTLAIADEYLAKNYKNVVVLLLDALGVSTLEKQLAEDGFFRSNVKHIYSSVYPPTTVAATTSLLSGCYPNEHGWLGWDIYFPELDKNVTVFRNTEQLTELPGAKQTICTDGKKWGKDSLVKTMPFSDFDVGTKYIPYISILNRINDVGGQAYLSMPYAEPYPDTFEKVLGRIKDLCDEPGGKFIYAYWDEPDSTMHRTGTMSAETHNVTRSIEEQVSEVVSTLSDTLILITADHGHIDCNNLCILDYPEVADCLVRMPSIEPRTLNLFVKEEHKAEFPAVFRKYFGDDFLLLTREEVLAEKLFGIGNNRQGLEKMIGDFVALATSDTAIFPTHYEAQEMPGGHAGLTAEEMRIPLIVVET